MKISPVLFGAQLEVHSLVPNHARTEERIRSKANSLLRDYAKFSDDDIRFDIYGQYHYWQNSFGTIVGYTPTVIANIQVRTANKDRILDTEVSRKINEILPDEPIWKFFWRVRRETNKLINAAGLKPNKDSKE